MFVCLFLTDQVIRLSRELANAQCQDGDYSVLEPDPEQLESGFQSFQTERLTSQSSVDSTSTLALSPTAISPDWGARTSVDEHDDANSGLPDQPVEIRIKRTSSGKSPSKIPRFVGNAEDPRSAQISYYMSLKRGLKGGSQSKFFLQIQDSHSPYMQLLSPENVPLKKHYDSQSTLDSEADNVFETYLEPVNHIDNSDGFPAQLGELVALRLDHQSTTPSIAGTEQEDLSDRSSIGSFRDQSVTPNPIYQTIEQTIEELESTRTFVDALTDNLSSIDSGLPQPSPPPALPPRFEPETVLPPPVPPIPKTNQQGVVRRESNFTSYLTDTEIRSKSEPQTSKEDTENVTSLAQIAVQSWMWNDNSGMLQGFSNMGIQVSCF